MLRIPALKGSNEMHLKERLNSYTIPELVYSIRAGLFCFTFPLRVFGQRGPNLN